MKKTIRLLLVAILVIVTLAVPVLAADSNGNEIINIADYVQYSFPEDTSSGDVYADCYFPEQWFSTEVSGENWTGGVGTFYGSTFTYEPSQDIQSYRIRPVGGNVQNGEVVGDQIKYAHIIDLTAVPSHTWFHSSFQIKVNLPASDGQIYQEPTAYAYLFFVNESGQIVYKWYDKIEPYHYVEGDGGSGVIQAWSYALLTDLSALSLPDTAVGVVPLFTLKNLGAYADSITVNFEPFRFSYNLSFLQYQAQQNEKLQSTLNSIQDSMNELVDGEPDPVAPSGSDVVGDLNSAEDELKDMTQGGLDEAIGLLQNTLYVLQTNATAFFAVIALFRPFSQIPLFAGLLTISLSVSVCAIILAITHDIGKASKANKSKSGHNGKKGG